MNEKRDSWRGLIGIILLSFFNTFYLLHFSGGSCDFSCAIVYRGDFRNPDGYRYERSRALPSSLFAQYMCVYISDAVSLFFFFSRSFATRASLTSCRRVCRVTRRDPGAARLARPWASAVTWSLVNFWRGECDVTRWAPWTRFAPSGFPFHPEARALPLSLPLLSLSLRLSSEIRRSRIREIALINANRKPDIDRILRKARAERTDGVRERVWRKRIPEWTT